MAYFHEVMETPTDYSIKSVVSLRIAYGIWSLTGGHGSVKMPNRCASSLVAGRRAVQREQLSPVQKQI